MAVNPDAEALELVKPEVIGLVVTQKDDQINLCPVNWQVVSSTYEQPVTVCIGLSNHHKTLENILTTKEFCFAYPSKDQLKDTLYCGTVSDHETDKVKNTQFTFTPSTTINPPNLYLAVLNIECRLHQTVKMDNYTIVIGIAQQIHASSLAKLDKVYALGGNQYGIIEKIKNLQTGRT